MPGQTGGSVVPVGDALRALRSAGPEFGIVRFELGVVGLQCGVTRFQAEDLGYAGEVDSVCEQFRNSRETVEIVVAVAPGTTLGAAGVSNPRLS
jgi:hypothetical protein